MFDPDDINYSRLDVSALLESRGIAAVDAHRRNPCERWLSRHGYDLTTVDFGRPFPEVLAELGALLSWEQRSGYRLEDRGASSSALWDAFEFPVSAERGRVLIVLRPEALAVSEPKWFDGFLELTSDHSLVHLACGSRFFAPLVLARESPLPGRTYGRCQVPSAYQSLDAMEHGFLE
jgi:hypothetical protein